MTYIGWTILLVCISCGLILFFAACSISLRTFSRAKLAEISRYKNKKHLADKISENSEKFVLACAFYRAIVNMCIPLFLLYLFTNGGQEACSYSDYLYVFAIASLIFIVFSVAIPHALAKYAGEKVLSKSYWALQFAAGLIWPIFYIFQAYDGLVRRLAGVEKETAQQQEEGKQEEFLTDLEEHRIEGNVDAEEQEMIENVLGLSEKTVNEIITPRTDVVGFEANSDLNTIIEIIKKTGHSRYPVYRENIDNIIGMVYAKDLLGEIGKSATEFRLESKMREAHFVPETKTLRALLHEFQNQKLHIAVVLDEYGGTGGIVTLEDVLEEVVGEIIDEHERVSAEPIKKIDEQIIEVDARTYIDDLNAKFALSLPEEDDYDTIAGFVLSKLGYIPKANETFEYKNLKFTIVSAENRKIKRIRIQKASDANVN